MRSAKTGAITQNAGVAERTLTAITNELLARHPHDRNGQARRRRGGARARGDEQRSRAHGRGQHRDDPARRRRGGADAHRHGAEGREQGRADEFTAAVSQHVAQVTDLLDDQSNALIVALSGKGQEFAGEVSRITDQAVKSIEAKGFVFTQTMMDNSEEIARLINDASHNATAAMTRTLGQLQEGAQGVTEAAKSSMTRTLEDLHSATQSAIEESKQTASATVADMLETHGMLRSDTTALFERLREANILLQEVLSGAHENMSSLERTMVTRVSEFVAAMNDFGGNSDTTTAKVEQHLGTFNTVTCQVLDDLGDLATQFNTHGRSLAEAVELLDRSNRRAGRRPNPRRGGCCGRAALRPRRASVLAR